jgi:hypothetical protein
MGLLIEEVAEAGHVQGFQVNVAPTIKLFLQAHYQEWDSR